jgi:hypothetical protein
MSNSKRLGLYNLYRPKPTDALQFGSLLKTETPEGKPLRSIKL